MSIYSAIWKVSDIFGDRSRLSVVDLKADDAKKEKWKWYGHLKNTWHLTARIRKSYKLMVSIFIPSSSQYNSEMNLTTKTLFVPQELSSNAKSQRILLRRSLRLIQTTRHQSSNHCLLIQPQVNMVFPKGAPILPDHAHCLSPSGYQSERWGKLVTVLTCNKEINQRYCISCYTVG